MSTPDNAPTSKSNKPSSGDSGLLAKFFGVVAIALLASTIALGVLYVNETNKNKSMESQFPAIKPPTGDNPCAGKKPDENEYFDNVDCLVDGVLQSLEQAGANVTLGYKGNLTTDFREPITTPYFEAGLCPVNVVSKLYLLSRWQTFLRASAILLMPTLLSRFLIF